MTYIDVTLNGKKISVPNSSKLFELTKYTEIDAETSNTDIVYVLNGYNADKNSELSENDSIVILKKGEMPDQTELEYMLTARNLPGIYEKIKNSCIGIAGLGGLGSNIALSLARIGIGKLIIADFDVVEPTNLNRQQYFINQLGKPKTAALKELISNANPYVTVIEHNTMLNPENCLSIFKDCDVICEAFDNPESKAWFAESILCNLSDTTLISSSGMAGLGSSNEILTKKISKRFYICGDLKSDAKELGGLMSPRVSICAGHQANIALEIIVNRNK